MRAGYSFTLLALRRLFRLLYGVAVVGIENIPPCGRVILAANHRSNLDPPLVGAFIPREVYFMAKAELFRSGLFGRVIRYLNAFPVRRGEFDRQSLTACLDILRRDDGLLIFPEGTRAPADGFLRAKLGLGWVVCLSGAPVIPVYVHGTSSVWPRLRRRPSTAIVFGKPVPATDLQPEGLRGRELYQAVSDRVLDLIRELSLTTPGGRVCSQGTVYDRDTIEDPKLR